MDTTKFVEIKIDNRITEYELKGCYLYNKIHDHGGYFNYGNDKGFSIAGCWISSQTGDCLYDHIIINGYKVYSTIILEQQADSQINIQKDEENYG